MCPTATDTNTFCGLIYQFKPIVNSIIALLVAVAVLVFFTGILEMMYAANNNPKAYQEGKYFMIWGIIAIFVMTALGGILNFFAVDFFGKTVSSGGSSAPPSAEPAGSSDAAIQFGSDTGIQTSADGGIDLSTGGISPGGGISGGGGISPGGGIQSGPGVQIATSGSAFHFGGYVTPHQ